MMCFSPYDPKVKGVALDLLTKRMLAFSQMRVKHRFSPRMMQKLMADRGLTQAELARVTGLSSGHIAMLLSGARTRPSAATLLKIARALGVGVEDLMEEESDALASRG